MNFIHIDIYYLTIVVHSTYPDILVVSLDHSQSMFTSSHYMILYLLLHMYILIVTYFIHFDIVGYIG